MNCIEIYNCMGDMIYEEKNNLKGVMQIEAENFKQGIYYYTVTNCETRQKEEGKIVIKNNKMLHST